MNIDSIVTGIEQNIDGPQRLDYIKTIEWTNTIARISSLVLGILAISILILIPIICSLEIIYITIPTLRAFTDKIVYDGEPGFVQRTVQFTLRDAIKAIEISETIEHGENTALWIYLKIKLKAILLETFLVVFIAFGGGTALIYKAEQLFAGILQGWFGVQY